jgi:putative DNA primase/helicase
MAGNDGDEVDVLEQVSRGRRPHKPSDDEMACEFAARHAESLAYLHAQRDWRIWAGQHWKPDETLHAQEMVANLCSEFAANHGEPKLASGKTINAVLALARAKPELATTLGMWDRRPDLLGTPKGVVDLRTGKLRPALRTDYITKQTAVAPSGKCPLWIKTLGQVFQEDSAVISFVQRWQGYSLTGETREQKFVFGHGKGGNGKDIVFGTCMRVMGAYGAPMPMETLIHSNYDRHPTELADLLGLRLALAVETQKGRRWNEARVKALTGENEVKARFMRRDFFRFKPCCKLVVCGNQQPKLASVDAAWRRRMLFLPFEVSFTDKPNLHLADQLWAEAPGILAWMIEGAVVWYQFGLLPPDSVTGATETYMREQDTIARWIAECCVRGDNSKKTRTADLFRSWKEWCEAVNEYADSERSFSIRLDRDFRKTTNDKGQSCFIGITVRRQ